MYVCVCVCTRALAPCLLQIASGCDYYAFPNVGNATAATVVDDGWVGSDTLLANVLRIQGLLEDDKGDKKPLANQSFLTAVCAFLYQRVYDDFAGKTTYAHHGVGQSCPTCVASACVASACRDCHLLTAPHLYRWWDVLSRGLMGRWAGK